MMCAVGPVVPWVFLGAVVSWGSFLCVAGMAWYTSVCSEQSGNLAYYPPWIWAFVGLIGFARLWFEWKCLPYAIVPFAQAIHGDFKLACFSVSFYTWFLVGISKSMLFLVDGSSDCLFLVCLLHGLQCEGQRIEPVWNEVMQQSLFYGFPALTRYATIANITFVFWITTWVQLFYPLLESAPKSFQNAQAQPLEFRAGKGPEFEHRFATFFNKDMNHGTALFNMAEAAGFGTVASMMPAFPNAKVRACIEDETMANAKKAKPMVAHLRSAVPHALHRAGLVGALENVVQLNIQTTLFAIGRALHPTSPDVQWQVIMSIATSVMTCTLTILEAILFIQFFELAKPALPTCVKKMKTMHTEDYEVLSMAEQEGINEEALKKLRAQYNAFRLRESVFYVSIFICILGMAYGISKFVMCFICKNAVWNITGCVDLSHLVG